LVPPQVPSGLVLPVGDVPAVVEVALVVVVLALAVVVVVFAVVEAVVEPAVQVPKSDWQPVPQYWLVVPQ
jgi:hypothetical protein